MILKEVTLSLSTGLTTLTGPSGTGKSTLLRLMATAESPSSGTLLWRREPLPRARRSLRKVLGYAPQSVDLPEDLTGTEFGLHIAALKELDSKSARKQLLTLADQVGLLSSMDMRIGTFSGGMRRRLVFIQALLGLPELLILDEPTAELDQITARSLETIIAERAREAIVIMTTHLSRNSLLDSGALMRVIEGTVVNT